VDADADVPAAADAAVWGGLSNAGQTCGRVERVYVHEQVYDAFIAEVRARVSDLRAGPGGKIGPITMPGQRIIIGRHITDALDRGATALVPGIGVAPSRRRVAGTRRVCRPRRWCRSHRERDVPPVLSREGFTFLSPIPGRHRSDAACP